MAGSGQRFLRHMGAIVRGRGDANLEYSTGWGGVGNADQNSSMSEQTFQARIHCTRIWGPDTLMPISRMSQLSFPALQVRDPVCLKQSISVRIYGRVPFLSVRQSRWGQGSPLSHPPLSPPQFSRSVPFNHRTRCCSPRTGHPSNDPCPAMGVGRWSPGGTPWQTRL